MMIIIIILLSFLCTLSLGCLLRCQMRSAFILWRVFLFWSDTCYGLLYWLEREARSDRRSLWRHRRGLGGAEQRTQLRRFPPSLFPSPSFGSFWYILQSAGAVSVSVADELPSRRRRTKSFPSQLFCTNAHTHTKDFLILVFLVPQLRVEITHKKKRFFRGFTHFVLFVLSSNVRFCCSFSSLGNV